LCPSFRNVHYAYCSMLYHNGCRINLITLFQRFDWFDSTENLIWSRPSDYGMNEDTLKFMARMEDTVRKTFKFHPHIQSAADATIADVAKRFKKTSQTSQTSEITFVGIHNRRTDHIDFVKKTARAKPITKRYFKDAMEYFRSECAQSFYVIYLFIAFSVGTWLGHHELIIRWTYRTNSNLRVELKSLLEKQILWEM
jgi:hypothetical protein